MGQGDGSVVSDIDAVGVYVLCVLIGHLMGSAGCGAARSKSQSPMVPHATEPAPIPAARLTTPIWLKSSRLSPWLRQPRCFSGHGASLTFMTVWALGFGLLTEPPCSVCTETESYTAFVFAFNLLLKDRRYSVAVTAFLTTVSGAFRWRRVNGRQNAISPEAWGAWRHNC
jgi:hypothetical protein